SPFSESLLWAASTPSRERSVISNLSTSTSSASAKPYTMPLLPPVMRASFPFNVVIADYLLPVEISIPARKKDDFQCIIAVIFSAKSGNNIAAQYVILGMHFPSETIFDAWVSSSHVYAPDQGAVVTTVLLMGQDQFA